MNTLALDRTVGKTQTDYKELWGEVVPGSGQYAPLSIPVDPATGLPVATADDVESGTGTVDNTVEIVRVVGQKRVRLTHTAVSGKVYVILRPEGTVADVPSSTNYTWALDVGGWVEVDITDALELAFVGQDATPRNYRYEAEV